MSVDRELLMLSTACYLAAVLRSVWALRKRLFRRSGFNFVMVLLGFSLQTGFLALRGHALGRCPITNLFEVLIFLAWSIALIYMVIGPTYRLSLMGSFTSPLVFFLQSFALVAPVDGPHDMRITPNAWLEFHASISLVAYGAFALACVAGIMYLVQERQLKTRELHSIFFHLPPLPNLFSVMKRLLWLGFIFYTAGLVSGFYTGEPLPWVKVILACGIWVVYGAILIGPHLHAIAPRRVAAFCVAAFAAALSLLWSIEFVGRHA